MWCLGVSISFDKTAIGFQGRHQDKRRITYNSEGYGLNAGDLYQYGLCYQFFFINDPSPQKYINMGLSPLNARAMAVFDTVYDEYHQCEMKVFKITITSLKCYAMA